MTTTDMFERVRLSLELALREYERGGKAMAFGDLMRTDAALADLAAIVASELGAEGRP